MLICSLRNSFVLLLVLLSICQGRAQKNESDANPVRGGNSSSPAASPFITSTDPLPAPSVSFNSSGSNNDEAGAPAAADVSAPSPGVLLPASSGACPARLLTLLQEQHNKQQQQKQQQQQQPRRAAAGNATKNATKQNSTSDQEPQQQPASQEQRRQQLPAWPPEPLRSGLTCTMEVSHLAVAMPGSAHVCSAFRIKNNLMSALYSWQLVWEPGAAGGLLAAGADGAVVISSDPGA
ncbi:hypothetical protein OEZ86_011340 [Tetradesmus obliquus]|nr:hypothetical protein OEZ86_011340 [Tetradesmus obliquus]